LVEGSARAGRRPRGHDALDLADPRLSRIDAVVRKHREQHRAERLEGVVGLPRVEDVDLLVDVEGDVERPGGSSSAPRRSLIAAYVSTSRFWSSK
jgi:hypothetical protein